MRHSIKTFWAAFAISTALVTGPALSRHGVDDGPDDMIDRGDLPEISTAEDRSETMSTVADVSDKSDRADRSSDISDRGGGRDVSGRDDRDNTPDDISESRTESADAKSNDPAEDRIDLGSNSGSSSDKSDLSASAEESNDTSVEDSDSDDKSGSSSSGSGSSDRDDKEESGSNSGSGSSGSGSSGSGSSDDESADDDDSGSGSSGSGSSDDDEAEDGDGELGKHGESDDSDVKYARFGGPSVFEFDNEGRERRSSEVLFLGGERQIEAIRRAGYEVVVEKRLSALGNSLVRIRVHKGENVEASLKSLRALAPEAWIDANYGYRASSDRALPQEGVRVTSKSLTLGRIGIIDTGADAALGGLGKGKTRAFASSSYTPRPHGTAVAQIAASRGVHVDVADVFELDSKGGAIASADAIARAVDWMVAQGAPVINISIEGPPNRVLDEVIQRALKAGAVVVAAAGNEGPLALPAYPAAYPGVVAVTAVDKNGKIYRRANQGDYVSFAAFGVRVPVSLGKSGSMVSGTSYAAPLIAAEAAQMHTALSLKNASLVVDKLKKRSIDKGPKGRDPIYGWGIIAID